MNRLFGSKSAAPKPTLDGAISKVHYTPDTTKGSFGLACATNTFFS